mgnify:CR=1 FL=1
MKKSNDVKRLEEITKVILKNDLKSGVSPSKVCNILTELGPTFIKIGQILSTRIDLIPKEYCAALSNLRNNTGVMPRDELEKILKEEYDDYKKVFKNILKLFIMISIVYLVSIVIGILICFDIILSYLLATLLAYINSVLILSTIYFIISMIEKIMYNEEEKNTKYSKGLLFIFLTVIALTISSSIITTYFYLVSTGIKEGPELVVLVLKYNKIERYLKYYLIAFAGFGFASALTYINKDRNSKLTVSILIFMLIMMACLNTVIPIINFIVVKNNEELVTMFMKTNLYIGFGLKIIFKAAMMMLLISISKFFNNKNLVLISGIMTFVLCIIGILLQMLQVQNWYLYSLSFNILEIIIISVFVVGLKVMNKPSALL